MVTPPELNPPDEDVSPALLSDTLPDALPDAPSDTLSDTLPITLLDTSPDMRFPIVGIGASAGGLAAFEAFFSAMPATPESNMAFVLVQHLAPDHKSILSDLVRRYTHMRVYEVEDGMTVRPNCAYIIPPNHDMAFLNGTLQLLEPTAPRGVRLTIDFFFRSLAQDQRERAICIVLSGTGSDGTLGVRAIKGEGGMVMAQSPESTEYDGMPRSAIATGMVDYVLPPSEMPAQLLAYVSHTFGTRYGPLVITSPKVEDALRKICIVLRSQTGHDFSLYKENTLIRRTERRMALHQIDRADDYLQFLQKQTTEVDALFRDLLIGVTSFFRDTEAFAMLEAQAIPRMFAGKSAGQMIRVWVCGCSTGEEAYSLAILIQEYMESLKQTFRVQIFATDVDSRAIDQARSGVFPSSIAADVTPERMNRFFVQTNDGGRYRVHKSIRDMLVFSEQDVIKDPPFSKLDLISCRNLLIYLSVSLQRKLIPLFHYALRPTGVLFLGTSETIGEFTTLFTSLDRRWKIYLRQEDSVGSVRMVLSDVTPIMAVTDGDISQPQNPGRSERKLDLRELTERTLLTHFAPVGVLVNGRGEILHIYGRTGNYLEPAPGDAGMNILLMAREGLRRELTTALYKAVSKREPVRYPGLRVRTNGSFTIINLTVRPASTGSDRTSDMFLVVLEEVQATTPDIPPSNEEVQATTPDIPPSNAEVPSERAIVRDQHIAALEQELQAKDEYLQTTLEEMETANEELQSTNEELQSTNEELETSKEELQSVNEELSTVNAELQNKVFDLSRANNDMNNLLAGTGVGTLFVDMHMQITRFTPAITQVINLILPDVGRPLGDIASNLTNYPHLIRDVQAVLDDLVFRETEVQVKTGAWYLMRIRPYRTLENVIEGAVMTFVDITQLKLMEGKLRGSTTGNSIPPSP